MSKFAAYQSVKVTDKEYERFGQVGVAVGPGDVPGETNVKFESTKGGTAPQEFDTFPDEALEGL